MITLAVRYAKNLKEKSMGLLNTTTPESLFMQTRFGIHTFGMRYPIDIVILDNNNTVVKTKESLSTNSIFVWNPRYSSVLELPKGTIKALNIEKGKRIKLTELM
jgi:uncharacterized protein